MLLPRVHGNLFFFKCAAATLVTLTYLSLVLGATLSGILIIALALIVGTVFYRKKLPRKERDPISIVGEQSVLNPGQA